MAKSSIEFRSPASVDPVADVTSSDEARMYDKAAPQSPNCFFIPLGKKGYISWQSDSPASVLALSMFFLLLFTFVVVAIISALASGPPWATKAIELLGQALLAIVGVVVGAGATSKK